MLCSRPRELWLSIYSRNGGEGDSNKSLVVWVTQLGGNAVGWGCGWVLGDLVCEEGGLQP